LPLLLFDAGCGARRHAAAALKLDKSTGTNGALALEQAEPLGGRGCCSWRARSSMGSPTSSKQTQLPQAKPIC